MGRIYFWVLFIFIAFLFWWAWNILPPAKREKGVVLHAQKSWERLIDTIAQKELSLSQKTRLAHWRSAADYAHLVGFWRDSVVQPVAQIPLHYYMGEWGVLEKSIKKMIFAGSFFLSRYSALTEEKAALKALCIDRARFYFEQAREAQPQNDSVRVGAALLQIYTGARPMEGVGLLKDIYTQTGNEYAAKELAFAYYRVGKFQQVCDILRVLDEKGQGDEALWLCLGESYAALRDTKKARYYYRQAQNKLRKKNAYWGMLEARIKQLE